MLSTKIITYVSPKTNQEIADGLCSQLPIILKPVESVEELFPLLSSTWYHTDFVCVSIDMFQERADGLNMFDIIHTLATLIKSTVYRPSPSAKPEKRSTKIFVIVDENTDIQLIKEVAQSPDIVSVGWILTKPEDIPSTLEHIQGLAQGDYTHHKNVLERLKPKKKTSIAVAEPTGIVLTTRQKQVLKLVQDRGASNKTIARILNLSESTVKLHMSAIFKKYGVKSRTQLAVFARK